MKNRANDLSSYYMTCRNYYTELLKKEFGSWFLAYYSSLRGKDGWILDVGCGVGQVVNQLAQNGFCAIGVDISPVGIKVATRQGAGTFVVASADNLPFQDSSFASVGFCDFLEHTSDPEACLGEIARVLEPCGTLVASAPNFLRVIGLSREYHWHMLGVKQKSSNLCNLLRKAVLSKLSPQMMRFEFMLPQLDPKGRGGDLDAICVTNPIDMKFRLRKLGIRIIGESAAPNYPRGVVKMLGRVPFVRSISGHTFLVGIRVTCGGHRKEKSL